MSEQTMPFQIAHPDGRVYELAGDNAGLDVFIEQYKPQGFAVVVPPPTHYGAPDFKAVREARKAASEREHAAVEAKVVKDEPPVTDKP